MRLMYVLLSLLILTGCENTDERNSGSEKKLIIYHAGSLALPLKQMSELFKAEHPDTDIQLHAAGSVTCARMITEMGKPCDVFASADINVIDSLLISEFADWSIAFATNEMVIGYNGNSLLADEVSLDNWTTILQDSSVKVGRSDPEADPCGYRTILTIKLAAVHYSSPELESRLLAPERSVIRPKSMDLLALLEAGSVDYVFLYRSVAEQMKLTYIRLPDDVNLSAPEKASIYARQRVTLTGRKPGDTYSRAGEPMIYGVTIPTTAPNAALGQEFVAFLLTKTKGLRVLEAMGQPTLIPYPTSTYANLPERLKSFVVEGEKP